MPREKDFQKGFSKWVVRHPQWFSTACFELKLVKGNSLPFSLVKEHQIRNLQLAKNRIFWKIPDDSRGEKPFDCFQICEADAFVVVMYYTERGEKDFYLIDIDVFIEEMGSSDRKSLTRERAAIIGNVHNLSE